MLFCCVYSMGQCKILVWPNFTVVHFVTLSLTIVSLLTHFETTHHIDIEVIVPVDDIQSLGLLTEVQTPHRSGHLQQGLQGEITRLHHHHPATLPALQVYPPIAVRAQTHRLEELPVHHPRLDSPPFLASIVDTTDEISVFKDFFW